MELPRTPMSAGGPGTPLAPPTITTTESPEKDRQEWMIDVLEILASKYNNASHEDAALLLNSLQHWLVTVAEGVDFTFDVPLPTKTRIGTEDETQATDSQSSSALDASDTTPTKDRNARSRKLSRRRRRVAKSRDTLPTRSSDKAAGVDKPDASQPTNDEASMRTKELARQRQRMKMSSGYLCESFSEAHIRGAQLAFFDEVAELQDEDGFLFPPDKVAETTELFFFYVFGKIGIRRVETLLKSLRNPAQKSATYVLANAARNAAQLDGITEDTRLFFKLSETVFLTDCVVGGPTVMQACQNFDAHVKMAARFFELEAKARSGDRAVREMLTKYDCTPTSGRKWSDCVKKFLYPRLGLKTETQLSTKISMIQGVTILTDHFSTGILPFLRSNETVYLTRLGNARLQMVYPILFRIMEPAKRVFEAVRDNVMEHVLGGELPVIGTLGGKPGNHLLDRLDLATKYTSGDDEMDIDLVV